MYSMGNYHFSSCWKGRGVITHRVVVLHKKLIITMNLVRGYLNVFSLSTCLKYFDMQQHTKLDYELTRLD